MYKPKESPFSDSDSDPEHADNAPLLSPSNTKDLRKRNTEFETEPSPSNLQNIDGTSFLDWEKASLRHLVYELRAPLQAGFSYILLAHAKQMILLPFIRTLIWCDDPTNSTEFSSTTNNSSQWSGSSHCDNLEFVAGEAQFLKGIADGLDQILHCLFLPALGHATDVFGRKWSLRVGISGALLQYVLFILASILPVRSALPYILVVLASIVQGATGIFMTTVFTSVSDRVLAGSESESESESESDRNIDTTQTQKAKGGNRAFGILQFNNMASNTISGLVTTFLIISHNLSTYTIVWLLICIGACLVLVLVEVTFDSPPNQGTTKDFNWKKANPFHMFALFREHPAMKWLALALFFMALGHSAMTILQAFMIAQYKWSQTKATVVFFICGPFALLSLFASFYLIPWIGARLVLLAATTLQVAALACFACASLSPVFLYLGLVLVSSGGGSMPAFMQLLSEMLPDGLRAHIVSIKMSVVLGAIAIGSICYSALFKALPGFRTLSFVFGLFFLLVALTCLVRFGQVVRKDTKSWTPKGKTKNDPEVHPEEDPLFLSLGEMEDDAEFLSL